MKPIMRKVLQMILYGEPKWEDLEHIAKWLKRIPKEDVISIYEYGKYLDFMNFRSMFIEGVEKRDFELVKKAHDLFGEKLYEEAKQFRIPWDSPEEYYELRRKLGFKIKEVA